jgi:type I restriction enzyme R subunit
LKPRGTQIRRQSSAADREELRLQATNNTQAQFGASPTLTNEVLNAAMDGFAAHSSLSKQVLDSDQARQA